MNHYGLAVHSGRPIYHVDICAGSGMLGLGLKLALGGRLRTVAYVEREARTASLIVERMEESHLDSAPVWDDVAECRSPEFVEFVQQFDPLLVSAGYPCTPFSDAGLRRGADDERHLWPFILDFARIVRPRYLFLENVAGHLSLGFDVVVADLQATGYNIAAGLFTAAEVGASHERKRLFALALRDDTVGDPEGADRRLPIARQRNEGIDETNCRDEAGKSGKILADSGGAGREGSGGTEPPDQRDRQETSGSTPQLCELLFAPGPDDLDAWRRILAKDPTLEPSICGTADGMAAGLVADRLRIIGNGVSTLVVAYAFTILAAAHVARNEAPG